MSTHMFDEIQIGRGGLCRRRFLKTISAASLTAGTRGFRDLLATEANARRRRG